jgi:multidrug transporter EmrE-like cation transporter
MNFISREDMHYALALTALEVVADASLKAASQRPGAWLSPFGGSLYLIIAYVLQMSVMRNNLGIVNAAWNAGTTITGVLTGMWFGETYTYKQLAGILFIALGVFLI